MTTAAGAHRALGAFARAETLLAAAEATAAAAAGSAEPDGLGLVRGYLFQRVASLHWGLGRLDDACALLDRAHAWRTDPGWQHWVRAQRVTQLSTGGRLAGAVDEGRRLLAEPDLDPATRLPLAVGHAFAWHQTGCVLGSLELIDDAVAAAGPQVSVDWPPDAMWSLVAIVGGVRWAEAETRLIGLRDAALVEGNVANAGYAELLLGQLRLAQGAPIDALHRLTEAEAHLGVQDSRGLLGPCRALRVAAIALSGRADDEVVAYRDHRGGLTPHGWAGRAEGALADVWAASADGDASQAIELALDFAEVSVEAPLVRATFLHEAVRVGAPPRRVLADLRAAVAGTDSPLAAAALVHVEALARNDAAGLDRAAEAFAAIGANLRAAEATMAAATAHRAHGSVARAADALARCAVLLERCPGAVTPALRVAADRAGPTTREQEVATLAARGLANAAIAQRLVLSVRTVESHLYRAMTKLDVTRREDLTALLSGSPSS